MIRLNQPVINICIDMFAMCRLSNKSDLDQILSGKRPSSRWGPPIGVVLHSTCLTLLVSPDSAPGVASAVLASLAPTDAVFVFWSEYPKRLFVRISYVMTTLGSMCTRNREVADRSVPASSRWAVRISDGFFFFVCHFRFFSFFCWRHVLV